MTSTIRVAIIRADESQPVEFTEIENTLAAKQHIVDGYIEAVRLRDNQYGSMAMDFYCNEEFLYREDLEANRRASALYLLSFMAVNYIGGDVVCIGGVDQHGNDKGLSREQEDHLKKLFPNRCRDPQAIEPTC
jgi:Domain of unknown function (DUF3846)